jgi:hypothetical protein
MAETADFSGCDGVMAGIACVFENGSKIKECR